MHIRDSNSQIEYKIEECIGEGLNSWVYRAYKQDRAETFCHPIALKVLKSKTSDQVLRDDYRSLLKVNSRYCVRVFGFDLLDGHPSLILELVDGVSFLQLCLSGELKENQLVEIVNQALLGLKDIHHQELRHGDLSPNNILITKDNNVKLIDFGCSNRDSDRCLYATPEFVDPKVIRGEGGGEESDFFSLAEVYRFGAKFCNPPLNPRTIEENVQTLRKGRALKAQQSKVFEKVYEKWALSFLIIGSLLLPPTYVRSGVRSEIQRESTLHIRTNKWMRIKINGVDQGYTPVEVNVSPGKVIVEWSQNEEFRSRPLTIGEGENIVLNDSFFASFSDGE